MNKKVVIGIIVAVLVAVIAFGEYLYYTASNSTMTEEEAEEYLSSKQENEAIVSNENTTETEEVIPEDTLGNSKILIAYFSRADENYKVGTVEVGNTDGLAIRGETARKEESRSTVENWLEGLGF